MGVTGLWTVVHPCARPVKIETLNKKRLAVDASIWIYQFLKAVRDKEGNALRNSHVVGFFRRICKLLFFGIQPVFVFDGGAPALKRQTINSRKQRREGRREDAVKTAGKLLALQMQRRAEEEEQRRKEEASRPKHVQNVEEEAVPENLVYVEEIHMTQQERQQNRKFKKTDAYHLPELDVSMAEMGQPNDPRIMSLEELEQYAKQFHTGEDINVYDFSKIDFDSPFFTSLPASDRYNILNAARLRSRLRMGHSKEQLDAMFPDRMAFSRFQIERVAERNNLTQRLMHINSGNDELGFGVNAVSRIAGEKGREYVLVKNDGVEGGWALGVVSNEGQQDKPIDVEKLDEPSDVDEESDEDEFEDVPIEGLNRLPKKAQTQSRPVGDIIARDLERRRALYKSRNGKAAQPKKPRVQDDPDSLFVTAVSEDEEWEDVGLPTDANLRDGPVPPTHEDEELQRAIAMSMQQDAVPSAVDEEDDYAEVFEQSKADEPRPFTKGSGMTIAHMANNRSVKVVPRPFLEEDSDDDIDLRAGLAESRKTKHKAPQNSFAGPSSSKPVLQPVVSKPTGFSGPLPFEKLDLGSSILGKKKMQKIAEDSAGGFEKDPEKPKQKESKPLPPWFAGNLDEGISAQKAVEAEERRRDKELDADEFSFDEPVRLRKHDTSEVIDLEAPERKSQDVIEIISSDEEEDDDTDMEDPPVDEPIPNMGDLADRIRAEPPPEVMQEVADIRSEAIPSNSVVPSQEERVASDEEPLEWEASDHEGQAGQSLPQHIQVEPAGGVLQLVLTPGPEEEEEEEEEEDDFEDVEIPAAPPVTTGPDPFMDVLEDDEEQRAPVPMSGLGNEQPDGDADIPFEDDVYSDPEDEELFRSLAQEEEEHARFASTLNHRSAVENAAEYERELKQLRNQQKKDRRDADEVTQTMITECQQLLSLFGLPYITAPMEAEAQCAELVKLGLVDGIVTDDSDIFLFGGTRVYKNMFNQAKFVECYLTNDLEAEFGLSRDRLISIAQLLGSDYTDGLPGVGPVTALEILSEFDTLTAFKDWWNDVQIGQRSKQDDAANPFRRKFRKNSTKIFLPMTFPNPRVEEAYLEPEVDKDPSGFVWGVPDLSALRSFLMATIGWTPERTDEVLVPVIKDMNRRAAEGTQANITQFFGGGVGVGAFAPRKRAEAGSKRLENALLRIGAKARGNAAGEVDDEVEAIVVGEGPAPTAEKATKQKPAPKGKRTKNVAAAEDSTESEDYAEPRKKARKTTKKSKKPKEIASVASE
jgi:DNA excision repair protein ERCC-5